jgi:hypothetical protein
MRATITELMHDNLLEVFNERDSARRRATIERVLQSCETASSSSCIPCRQIMAANLRVCPPPPATI